MPTDLKYIMFSATDPGCKGCDTPVVFPPWLGHKNVALALAPLLGTPRSAGFVRVAWAGVLVYGESDSLCLKHHIEDSEVLGMLLDAPAQRSAVSRDVLGTDKFPKD